MATFQRIAGIKASLSKKLSSGIETLSDEDVEATKDMFAQLDHMEVTLDILTRTLIGTIVSKFKSHDEVGPAAKALVKKWKRAAKEEAASSPAAATTESPPPPTVKAAPPGGGGATAAAVSGNKKQQRRDSSTMSDSDAKALQEDWASLQPHRQTTCQKLHGILKLAKPSLVKDGINPHAVDQLLVERTTEVEGAIQKTNFREKSEYLSKARSLCFNIKKNVGLASQIILGHISADDLVGMSSEQLACDEKRKEMEERTKKLMESRQLDWDSQNESKINEMCGIRGELLQASLFTWYVPVSQRYIK